MSNQQLNAGGYLDLLTKQELKETMGHELDAAIARWYRGVDYLIYTGAGNGTSLLTIPYVPEQGYSWSLKLISAYAGGLSALSITAYLSDTANSNLIGTVTGPSAAPGTAVLTWSSDQIVIKDGRSITLTASATIANWLMAVKQVPTEMQGKL